MQERFGLFDTRPNRLEIRIALAIVALIFILLLAVIPVAGVHIGLLVGLVPAFSVGAIICDLITAAILYAQAAVFRSRALTVLASGYVFCGLLLIPWALSYPGAFSEHGLLGARLNTTGWIAVCWRLSLPTTILLYAWLKRADAAAGPPARRAPPARIVEGALGAAVLAVLVTLLTTLGHDWLPSFFIDRSEVIWSRLLMVNIATAALTLGAMAPLFRREKSVLDMWLLVALSAWLAQSMLNTFVHSRFSIGASAFLGLVLVSNLTVTLALIAETVRLYARLARSTAARERERDVRLMSADAIVATINHEIGQPLTAANLSASNALHYLGLPTPDTDRAIKSLHDSIEAGHRTFDVIKSIRATYSRDLGELSEVSLNELVRETELLMDRELAAERIRLRFSLDEAMPPILANRVQLQRVFVNLFANAIDSIAARRRRTRTIAVRSALSDDRFVTVDFSDSGDGIPPEKLPHIFDPFVTTKSKGTGLGLSLSRAIIEEHGGRLWASPDADQGATFHIELPLDSGVK